LIVGRHDRLRHSVVLSRAGKFAGTGGGVGLIDPVLLYNLAPPLRLDHTPRGGPYSTSMDRDCP
jgi:hypothetical protein